MAGSAALIWPAVCGGVCAPNTALRSCIAWIVLIAAVANRITVPTFEAAPLPSSGAELRSAPPTRAAPAYIAAEIQRLRRRSVKAACSTGTKPSRPTV